jgi:CheY-like chemotaxis protein
MNEDVVLDVNLSHKTIVSPRVPVEGLGGALNQLDEQITTIVVIDDNPMDTRLIKRLLQSRKPYRIFEAASAVEGLEIISQRLPDLIITDLSMPGMDGFTLVERLKQEPETANIPIIVVTAKDLTTEDEFRLASQTSSIWLKGRFSTHDLVEHVVDTLSGEGNRITKEEAIPANVPVSGVEKTVVLVEDNLMDARLISRILQVELPLKIRQVQSGTTALDVIRAERPHLIILDLVIPGKNGFQILFELKQDEALDTIPVIVITSKELTDYEKEMLVANGVSSLWQKGQIDRKKLVAQVEAQLE